MLQPKVIEAIDYIRKINKQHPDVDATYKHISRSGASSIYETTVAIIIDVVIDKNVIENRKSTSGQASYFNLHEESNKTVRTSPEKTFDEVNLSVTTCNITTTPLNVVEALNSFNVLNTAVNTFNIDLDASIPSSPRPSLLSSDSEKNNILKIETQLEEWKDHMNRELSIKLTRSLRI